MFEPKPVTLSTDRVELQPLTMAHLEAFHKAANFDDQWVWVRSNPCTTIDATRQWMQTALDNAAEGIEVPFAIIDKVSGQLVGSTRYLTIRPNDHGLEIGHSWINRDFHRTYVNSSAKFLLLRHAFESLNAIRVEFKTHEKNQRSRNAIGRLGAQLEGVMRNHRILLDGTVRNTALFSITDADWPTVKQKLLAAVERVEEV